MNKRNLLLTASYMQGVLDGVADGLSILSHSLLREWLVQTEWWLDSHSFQHIQSLAPPLETDFFATLEERKLQVRRPSFPLLQRGINYLWTGTVPMLEEDSFFPPWSLILKVFEPFGTLPWDGVFSSHATTNMDLVSSHGGQELLPSPSWFIPLSESWRSDCLRHFPVSTKAFTYRFSTENRLFSLFQTVSAIFVGHPRPWSANQYESF